PQLDAPTVFGCCMKYGAGLLVYQPALAERTAVAEGKVALLAADAAGEAPTPAAEVAAEAACCVMFTGGTTGRSKGALLSNGAVMQGVVNGCYGYKDVFRQRYLLVLPLSHVFGLIRNLMTCFYTGSTLFFCLNNKDMFRDIAVFRPTILVTVPALAEMALTLSKKFGKNMLGPDMKVIISGAAAVPPYLISEYEKLGITLFPGYGLTESANLVSGNPENKAHPESVGFLFPNQEVKVVDGELWLKGRNIMDCYVGEEESGFEDGWFKTGDLVRFDENGLLYITGRIKEIIVLPSGENISPAEVEAKFNELTCVQDSQVFEALNDAGDHILALEVVPRMTELGGIENVPAFVKEACEKVNAALPSFMRVSRITVRDTDFKRTPSMKIERYKTVQ
ncbi:MAG: AMP-binding protein, partial [Lachnospiraceae bacterium]|nr:AMP-binding protein [Lachnospiraceae bacterium]